MRCVEATDLKITRNKSDSIDSLITDGHFFDSATTHGEFTNLAATHGDLPKTRTRVAADAKLVEQL